MAKSKRNRVPRKWGRWRQRQRDRMIYAGVPRSVANEFSALEAQGRDRLMALVGRYGAHNATLVCATDLDGNDRFFLVGDMEDVPGPNRAVVRDLSLDAFTF